MFRVWPTFARKNFFLLMSYRTARGFNVHVPLPLFLADGLIEPLSLLVGFGIGRFVPVRVTRFLPYFAAAGITGGTINDMWKALRWRGAFTLVDVDFGDGRFSMRFI